MHEVLGFIPNTTGEREEKEKNPKGNGALAGGAGSPLGATLILLSVSLCLSVYPSVCLPTCLFLYVCLSLSSKSDPIQTQTSHEAGHGPRRMFLNVNCHWYFGGFILRLALVDRVCGCLHTLKENKATKK